MDRQGEMLLGLETFQGRLMDAASWHVGHDLAGLRVGLVGTGPDAVRILPALVKTAARVKVFQRTPAWVLPAPDGAPGRGLPPSHPAAHPAWQAGWPLPGRWRARVLAWRVRAHLHRQVKEPWLRRQLTPDFRIPCERLLFSSDYYPALQQARCKLLTWPIDRIVAGGIRTVEGIEHQLDCIVIDAGAGAA